jgi:peptidylprolyl isomerase/FKBP-type peptidyl-prolyl cis-trans isomerase FklB
MPIYSGRLTISRPRLKGLSLALIPLLTSMPAAGAGAQGEAPRITSSSVSAETASYDIGLTVGNMLALNGLRDSLSRQALIRGLDEALAGKRVSAAQREAAQQFSRAARTEFARRNEAAARQFLSKNAVEKGVVTLPSGLQYRVVTPGEPNAPHPGPMDQVSLRYRASLPDGTLLDSSDEHPQAAIFRMNSMIKGWHEALGAMRPGAKWTVYVPPELGYGSNSPPPIPPAALIVYELELLTVDATSPPMPAPFPTSPKKP